MLESISKKSSMRQSASMPLHEGEGDLERWLRLIVTAQIGAPVGWRYSALPEVAH